MRNFRRIGLWIVLILLVAAAFAIVIAPALIIHPFRGQTPDGMKLAYLLRTWSPAVTLIVLVLSAGTSLFLWRRSKRWWSKTVLIICFLFNLLPAWLARQNHFEWMFNPLPGAEFVKADATSFVSGEDKVISIEINGEAAAYPIRQIAYHHVVQDQVGGVAVVATY